jgi:putative transposase
VIAAEKASGSVALRCRALGVSRSSYYAWARRGPSARARADEALGEQIAQIHAQSEGRYGSPRVHAALSKRGVRTGRKRVARLMRGRGLWGRRRRRFRVTTDSNHNRPVAPNLLQRRFQAPKADACWVADITYLWTAEGWLYLAVILDLFSRRVIGWSMAERLHSELALRALQMALGHRDARGVIHHSDRGSQYACAAYRALLAKAGMIASMSRRGDCLDNAVAESFFSTLKLELAYRTGWTTRTQARADVFEYLELFYNRRRSHSALGYCTPVEFELKAHASQAGAVRP